MTPLPFTLERTIVIHAAPATVFRYFTDPQRFAKWWGAGSTIEGRAGGAVRICYPGGGVASGRVLEIEAGRRVVFTYGYEDPRKPIPPGGSRVTITLAAQADGTRLHLLHEVHDAAVRDEHVAGWRYQLALFANVAASEQHAGAAQAVDRYLALWSESNAAARHDGFTALLTPEASFRDAFGCTHGAGDLSDHVGAVQVHMPGLNLERRGDVRHCQGAALVDWSATGPDGQTRAQGTNVFEFAPDGRIARIVGFWQR